MTAEALKTVGTGGQRVEKVKAAVAAAGALALVPVKTYHDGRQRVLLGKAGGRYADDALVPAFAGKHYGRAGSLAGEHGVGLPPDAGLDSLPATVKVAQLLRQLRGLGGIGGHEKPCGGGSLAQPPGGVEPGRQREADGRGGELFIAQTAHLQQGRYAHGGGRSDLIKTFFHKDAVFAGEPHHVRHSAHGHKIGVFFHQRRAVAPGGAHKLQRHAYAGQLFIGIGAAGPLGIHHGGGLWQGLIAALVVVGYYHVYAKAQSILRLCHGCDAAVHGDDKAHAGIFKNVDSPGVQPVALLDAVGDVGHGVQPRGAQPVGDKAGGGNAVHIVVAVYGHGLAFGDGLADARRRPVHVQHQRRVKKLFAAAAEKALGGRGGVYAFKTQNSCQQRRIACRCQRRGQRGTGICQFPVS